MNITKRQNPNQFISSLVDDVLSDFLPPLSKIKNQVLGPATNVSENENEIELSMAVPGLTKEKISISIDNRILTISYVDETNSESKTNAFIRKEYGLSSFSRSFTLPHYLDESLITSKLENGILTINCPKQEKEKSKIKSIEIQ